MLSILRDQTDPQEIKHARMRDQETRIIRFESRPIQPIRRLARFDPIRRVHQRDNPIKMIRRDRRERYQPRDQKRIAFKSKPLRQPHPSARGQNSPERRDHDHVPQFATAGHASREIKQAVHDQNRQRNHGATASGGTRLNGPSHLR